MASRQYPLKAGSASIVVATYEWCYGGSVNDLHASIATINGDSACSGREVGAIEIIKSKLQAGQVELKL